MVQCVKHGELKMYHCNFQVPIQLFFFYLLLSVLILKVQYTKIIYIYIFFFHALSSLARSSNERIVRESSFRNVLPCDNVGECVIPGC